MRVLYEDDRVFVCIKPVGVLSTDEPGGMPERIRTYLGDEKAVVKTVHRLDRVVGGVMVYARTARASSDLGKQMQTGAFHKEYRAVLRGEPPEMEGTLCDLLVRNKTLRKTFVTDVPGPEAKEAVLDYRVLETKAGLSLVSVRLYTGRTHQIRCQFASRGMPLFGDRKYGTGDETGPIGLWSCALEFIHPRTGETMRFKDNPPKCEPWDAFEEGVWYEQT